MIDQSLPFGKKHPLEGLEFFFLKASISFFISRLRLSKVYQHEKSKKPQKEKDQEKAQQFVF